MRNLYLSAIRAVCLIFIFHFIFASSAKAQQMVTYDTTFDGWNAIVTEDVSLTGTDSAAGIIFFPGIGEETTNIADLKVNGPHYLISNGLWDGSVTLGNGVHHPFIISLQPPTFGYPAEVVYPKIQAILARYRIKRNSLYFTGLSMGAWYANTFIGYEPTPGYIPYGSMVKAIVNLEGVEPADTGSIYPAMTYPNKMGHWAATTGGRELWVEGSQDWRDMLAGAQNMCDSVPNSATYFQVTYGGGAHCCWNTEYEPSTTWTLASNSNISQIVGTPQPMNVWQWMLRQGDTSMPGSAVTTAAPPTVTAGTAQTVVLPTNTATLKGAATANAGDTISTMSWSQVSGPGTATIASVVPALVKAVAQVLSAAVSAVTSSTDSASTQVTGLVAGTYVFKLTATQSNGLVSTSTVTITVDAAPVAPTVSAGSGQTITLPTSSITLTGTATGNNGATISSTLWKQSQGPVTATITSSGALSTAISGLTTAGTYVFQLTATDNDGLSASEPVTITVDAASTVAVAPTVDAGTSQTITLPTSSVNLNGTATGNDGATISSVTWNLISGPSWVKFTNEWALATEVYEMVAGTYVFDLNVTDSKGKTSTSQLTITVLPASTTSSDVAPTVNAGAAQTITLPVTTVALTGTATGNNGATISSTVWKQSSGPVTAEIATTADLSTALSGLTTAGSYVFQLTATDNDGLSTSGSVTITVNAASTASVAPTVNAGASQTITLPASSVNLNGTATGNNGATISSVTWNLMSGPSWVKFTNEWALSTEVYEMVAGTYVFDLNVTDSKGMTSTSQLKITVLPAATTTNMGATALSGMAALPDSSAMNAANFQLYPNPASGLINLQMNNAGTGTVLMMVYDAKGNKVQTVVAEKDQQYLGSALDVSKLKPGVYFLQIIIDNKTQITKQFIRQ